MYNCAFATSVAQTFRCDTSSRTQQENPRDSHQTALRRCWYHRTGGRNRRKRRDRNSCTSAILAGLVLQPTQLPLLRVQRRYEPGWLHQGTVRRLCILGLRALDRQSALQHQGERHIRRDAQEGRGQEGLHVRLEAEDRRVRGSAGRRSALRVRLQLQRRLDLQGPRGALEHCGTFVPQRSGQQNRQDPRWVPVLRVQEVTLPAQASTEA